MATQNGFAVRAFRQKDGLSVATMAQILDISETHYRRLEAETRDAQPEQIARIAKAVNVPPAALVRTPPDVVIGGSLSADREMVRA